MTLIILSATCNLSVYLREELSLLFQSLHILNILLGAVHMGKTFILTPTTAINCFIASVLCSVVLLMMIIQQSVVLLMVVFHH
mgnify:CR=1 FL=1